MTLARDIARPRDARLPAGVLEPGALHARTPFRMHIVQGQLLVSAQPEVSITTILGSCVAACLRDTVAGVGGMNHFLLPDDDRSGAEGVHAMELLINALLQAGAVRSRFEAKLFGGARMMAGLSDIGARNADFARRFLRDERVTLVAESLGGTQARRVEFWPVSGRARQAFAGTPEPIAPPPRRAPDAGSLELF